LHADPHTALEADESWRAALAIRLYFATGAKLQQILKARWSDIIENRWYPFLPEERKLWYECSERLGPSASAVIELLQAHHRDENISSPYLFPSADGPSKPIKTVQRHWDRFCGTFGWKNLPLSHVVLRHRGRTNPSYSLDFYRSYLNFDKASQGLADVSKVGNRRKVYSINSTNYMADR
jgi:integrase